MVTTWCPALSADPAVMYVGSAHDKFMELGTQTYNLAVGNLYGLGDIDVEPMTFNVSFDYPGAQGGFNRPGLPVLDMSALNFRDPGLSISAPPDYTPGTLSIPEAPVLDVVAPTLTFGPRPDSPVMAMPTEPADMIALVVPVAPDYVLPAVPTMAQLNLPAVPDVTLPQMAIDRPVWVDPPFQQDWHFDPTPYTRVLVDELVGTLKPMIVGSDALPAYIEQAIWEKGRSRIELEANRAVDQAASEFAARGFTEPQGQLSGRVLELRQGGQTAMAETTRDVMIKRFELAFEQQRFAITTGAALEGTLSTIHFEEQRYLLEAAKAQMDTALAVVNMRVSVFNAQMQGYQTDAQVFRDRIQAELSKVELYRAQLQGVQVLGELNTQQVQLYSAQLNGVRTMAEFYQTQVQTVKVQADINMQSIERYKAQLQAYGQRWEAYVAEWRGYSAGVEGESKRVDIYKAMVDANAKRVDAWATSGNFQIEMERMGQQTFATKTAAWSAKLEQLRAALQAEQARLEAVATSVRANVDLYQAQSQVEVAASAAADRTFELGLRRAQADVDTQLKQADQAITQAQFLLSQSVEIQKAKAQISSQLAASTMSAVNYGASVSSSMGNSRSCSTNFSFNGEIMDA